jgi:hypothetical protein
MIFNLLQLMNVYLNTQLGAYSHVKVPRILMVICDANIDGVIHHVL